MEPVSASAVLSTISSIITNGYQVYTYVAAVKHASNSARQLEVQVAALEQVFHQIEARIKSEEAKGRSTYDNASVLIRSVHDCNEEVSDFLERLESFRHPSRICRLFRRATWPLKEDETIKTAESLYRYALIFQIAMSTDTDTFLSQSCDEAISKLDGISDNVTIVKSDLSAAKGLLSDLSRQIGTKQYREFVRWFPTLDYQARHHDIQTQRLKDSGMWLLNSTAFQKWLKFDKANPTLFCQGGPGVGKSFLSSIVIDYLLQTRSVTKSKLAYFFFDYKTQAEQKPFLVVSCLLRQVLSQHNNAPKQLEALWTRFDRNEDPNLPSWLELIDIFCKLCSDTSVYIVLDALDECDASYNRGPILEFIEKARKHHVRLFATSRPFPEDVLYAFQGSQIVDVEASGADLDNYVREEIGKRKEAQKIMGKKLREKIVSDIVMKSQGMFLLATFQIRYVLAQPNKGQMEAVLAKLPKGLWENFDLTMDRIGAQPYDEQQHFAELTLLWITKSVRPLTVAELQHAMHITIDPTKFNAEDLPLQHLFVEYCFGLVVVDEKTRNVRLAHYSIDEYLRQRNFGFLQDGDKVVARACMNYMLIPELAGTLQILDKSDPATLEARASAVSGEINGFEDEEIPAGPPELADLRRIGRIVASKLGESSTTAIQLDQFQVPEGLAHLFLRIFPFLDYAVVYWGQHVAKDFCDDVETLVNRFLETHINLALWVYLDESIMAELLPRHNDRFSKRTSKQLERVTRLHVAARYGLWELVPPNNDQFAAQLSSTTINRDTPLMIACEQGQDDFVRKLMAQSLVDINAVDIDGNTALCRAAIADKLSTVQLLLEHPEVDINLGNPIQVTLSVSTASSLPILILKAILHDARLDINAFGLDSLPVPPLRKAVQELRIQEVQAILEREDIEPRLFRNPYPTLENSIAVLIEDTDIMTAEELQAFPAMIKEIAEYFWRKGKNDPQQRYLKWLWTWVCGKSDLGQHSEIFLDWIDKGWDREMVDEWGNGILHAAAAREGQDDFIRALVVRGYCLETPGDEGRTPLHVAAFNGNDTAVRLLVSLGARLEAKDEDGWTALHYAATRDNPSTIQCLISLGAAEDAVSGAGLTVLDAAARNGKRDVFKLMRGRGAGAARKTKDNRMLLQMAVEGEDEEIFRDVLAVTEDVNIFSAAGTSPLISAALGQNLSFVRLLIEKGANVNAAAPDGYTALHAVAARDDELLVEYLLGEGADPNANSPFFGTPYTVAVQSMAAVRNVLLQAGGDVSATGALGWSAIEYAQQNTTLRLELQMRTGKMPPSEDSNIRPRQIRQINAILEQILHDDMKTGMHYRVLGLLLALIGNFEAATISFEQLLSRTDNFIVHEGRRCRVCGANPITGSMLQCTSCPGMVMCLSCFSGHAAFRRTVFEQFSADQVFESWGKDEPWTAFLETNCLLKLRYNSLGTHAGRILSQRDKEDIILGALAREFDPPTMGLNEEFPWCTGEHMFLHLPTATWQTLKPGVVNAQGQSLKEWLRELYVLYNGEPEASTNSRGD